MCTTRVTFQRLSPPARQELMTANNVFFSFLHKCLVWKLLFRRMYRVPSPRITQDVDNLQFLGHIWWLWKYVLLLHRHVFITGRCTVQPCAAQEKMQRRKKVHQKSAQVWAAAANDPAVSSCRRHRQRMATSHDTSEDRLLPALFSNHHPSPPLTLLRGERLFLPPDLEEGGQKHTLKRWSQTFPLWLQVWSVEQKCLQPHPKDMRDVGGEKKI